MSNSSSVASGRTLTSRDNLQESSVPLAPADVLAPAQPPSHARAFDEGSNPAEDSALDALYEAHIRRSTSSSSGWPLSSPPPNSAPDRHDASFGLDPDADPNHALQGTPFRPAMSSPRHAHHRHQTVYDLPEEGAQSHTSAATGAPHTTETDLPHTETVPTVSATGAPRVLPRRTSRSPSVDDEKAESPLSQSDSLPPEIRPGYAPSGSLTVALFSPGLTWQRRGYLLLASIAINLGLPFINGVMLGFGEIFARGILAPWIGLAPAAININAPAARATTSNVGLRGAGSAKERR